MGYTGDRWQHASAGPAKSQVVPGADIAPDCRHYRGDRPCLHNRLCRGCHHYEPYKSRICIIKQSALGDVIRTLCILPAVRQHYPDAHSTWVSEPVAVACSQDTT